jgi:AcrR family transcriptional regulator
VARLRQVDKMAALDGAMECFWRRGYEATSLRDLTASTGLTAPSLYNAFGDKQNCFRAPCGIIWNIRRVTACVAWSRLSRPKKRCTDFSARSSSIRLAIAIEKDAFW